MTKLVGIIFWVLVIINAVGLISVVFMERKNPETAIAWILAIIFLPIIGLVLYAMFGTTFFMRDRRKLNTTRIEDRFNEQAMNQKVKSFFEGDSHQELPESEYKNIMLLNRNHGDAVLSEDNHIQVYTDANVKYADLFADLRNAKTTIHITYFIIQDDHYGNEFINILTEKAAAGLEVRLMYDVNASNHTPKKFFKPYLEAGGKLCRFLPSPLGNFLRINYRMHRKIVVIDGQIGYMGGMNIGDEYASMKPSITPWRDTHLRLTGSAVYALQSRFFVDWYNITGEDLSRLHNMGNYFARVNEPGNLPVQIVTSGPDIEDMLIYDAMIAMINNARHTIKIQTPYFIPDDAFLQAIKLAAKSGVDIQIMIPGIPDKKAVYQTTLTYIEDVFNWGVSVYRHKGFIHAKTIVIDDEICTIGSCNIDNRSFALDFEINAFVYDTAFAQNYSRIFEADKKDCEVLNKEFFDKRGLVIRGVAAITRLFSPLM
ncbi:cardiolipin synthase [Culicoidibacter larvae]|uniref:Cardiolipin synthase n=1 Tax=Culicoidibacter larvae TaxID=2579976 RepID=A0A5R8QF19_9FIRM|nr:cardiolipin synthase [Culicoidibacter larvae]TLG76629.1 cardiolipin synthase [Culicoidibacter larvae]